MATNFGQNSQAGVSKRLAIWCFDLTMFKDNIVAVCKFGQDCSGGGAVRH